MTRVLVTAFIIVAVCVVIHTTSIVTIGEWLIERQDRIARRSGLIYDTLHLIAIVTIIVILHLVEVIIWAVFYLGSGLFADLETSVYFSLSSYTTIGYGDVVLPRSWRLLGGIEGILGVLLCGVSTAFIFVIISALLQIRRQQPSTSGDVKA